MFESACLELVDFGVQPIQQVQQTKVSVQPVQVSQPAQFNQPAQAEKVEPKREQTEIERIWGNVLLKVKDNDYLIFEEYDEL